ncbi:HAD family hydrolase [Lamprocystis purpurea]|uniref:HAD family hydrolase n=1 Tax=Lamprocystis purpurea TaxID=61598 RepID=UPI0003A6FA69|nr:HAD family hydrolase [Lamprocystis purpurea]
MRHLLTLVTLLTFSPFVSAEALPSWTDGPTRTAITAFVEDVTTASSPSFVPPAERIAVFDNDGTLWVEQPMYTQLAYVIDRVKALAPAHPQWQEEQPFKAVLTGDLEALKASGMDGVTKLLAATHANMTTTEFERIVSDWIASARHPRFDRLYTQVVYQPMLELLDYLRANSFKTFIVSGGGIDFMRPWTERIYGIPPEQVIGSQIAMTYEVKNGTPVLMRKPEIAFIDDKAGKPAGIQQHIGRRPILAFGNSDGDYQMLEWTTAGAGKRLGLILHHDDGEREYAYDRESHVGRLSKGLDDAGSKGWVLVSMKRDWARVFPSAPEGSTGTPSDRHE